MTQDFIMVRLPWFNHWSIMLQPWYNHGTVCCLWFEYHGSTVVQLQPLYRNSHTSYTGDIERAPEVNKNIDSMNMLLKYLNAPLVRFVFFMCLLCFIFILFRVTFVGSTTWLELEI